MRSVYRWTNGQGKCDVTQGMYSETESKMQHHVTLDRERTTCRGRLARLDDDVSESTFLDT
jgi:hypothetical protein